MWLCVSPRYSLVQPVAAVSCVMSECWLPDQLPRFSSLHFLHISPISRSSPAPSLPKPVPSLNFHHMSSPSFKHRISQKHVDAIEKQWSCLPSCTPTTSYLSVFLFLTLCTSSPCISAPHILASLLGYSANTEVNPTHPPACSVQAAYLRRSHWRITREEAPTLEGAKHLLQHLRGGMIAAQQS